MTEKKHYSIDFYNWLMTQTGRDDLIGDLAGDVKRDPSFPKISESIDSLLDYLSSKQVCDGSIDAFKNAWSEHLRSN